MGRSYVPHPGPGNGSGPAEFSDTTGSAVSAFCSNQHDGDERPDAGDGQQPLPTGVIPPAGLELEIQAPDLRVEHAQECQPVLADRGGDRRERQRPELLVDRGRSAIAWPGRLEVAARQHRL